MPISMATTAVRVSQIREWIAASDRDGTARSDLELHLSHRDLSGLKRSRDVLVDEISFANGTITFLGVEITESAMSASRLKRRAVG